MAGQLLKTYIKVNNLRPSEFAKKIGRTRQNVHYWTSNDATVELAENGGIRIRLVRGHIVHETKPTGTVEEI